MSEGMQHNVCKWCGACDGRAGLLINGFCLNCHTTQKTGDAFIDITLDRTTEEIKKTLALVA